MNWIYQICKLLIIYTNSILFIYYFRNMLVAKKNDSKSLVHDFLIFVVFSCISLLLQQYPILKVIFYVFYVSFYALLLYSDPIGKKVFFLTIMFIVSIFIENSSGIIVVKVLNFPVDYLKTNIYALITMNCIGLTFEYILFSAIILTVRRKLYYAKSKDLLRLSMFPISQIFILFLVYLTIISNDKLIISYGFIIALLVCFISDLFLIETVKRISEMSKIEIEHQYLLQQNSLQTQHYSTLKNQFEYMHILRHEITNHLQTLKILMEKNEMDQAEKIVNELNDVYMSFLSTGYCENKIVDAVLHNKILYANQKNIDLDIKCSIPENIAVRDIDLMTIFCNLLDNAIDACENNTAGTNFISFQCIIQAGFLIIKCINSKANHISSSNGTVSTKKDKENHGFGIKIIRQLTEKYDGTAYFEDQKNTFLSLISLRCETDLNVD